MKQFRILLLVGALMCSSFVHASSLKGTAVERDGDTKVDRFVLPKAGDLALGIDMGPALYYLGNMFNNSDENGLDGFGGRPVLEDSWSYVSNPDVSLMGRYMFTDHLALQFNVGICHKNLSERLYSRDDIAFMEDRKTDEKVIDVMTLNGSGMSMSVGAQYRRGYRRVQGYAGANLIYGFGKGSQAFQYGNAITEDNDVPSRNSFEGANYVPGAPDHWSRAYALKKYNQDSAQYFGLGANVGVELFLASYISLGGELSLNAIWKFDSPSYTLSEGFNSVSNKVEQRTDLVSPGNRSFSFATENLGACIYMMFYF